MLQAGVYAHKQSGDIAILYITKFGRRNYYFWEFEDDKLVGSYDAARIPCKEFSYLGAL